MYICFLSVFAVNKLLLSLVSPGLHPDLYAETTGGL